MQEALKFSEEPELRDAQSSANDDGAETDTDARSHDGDHDHDHDHEPQDQVSLQEKDESSDAGTPDRSYTAKVVEKSDEPWIAEMTDMFEPRSPIVPLNAQHSSYTTTLADPPSTFELIRTPLLAIAAAVALVVAGWNYSSLEETRAKLDRMTEAKAGVDRTLAEAQSRLTNAEKAVAAVKAALTSVPAVAATGAAATAAERKTEAAPK